MTKVSDEVKQRIRAEKLPTKDLVLKYGLSRSTIQRVVAAQKEEEVQEGELPDMASLGKDFLDLPQPRLRGPTLDDAAIAKLLSGLDNPPHCRHPPNPGNPLFKRF